ncbi:MAG: YHS domain-containing (seleno)protein [Pseudomonadota bacterium]
MKIRTLFAAVAFATAPAIISAPAAHADKAPVYTAWNSNVAVQGYDPVAYFTEREPVKGSKDYSTDYNGAEFRFASAENLATFEADPEAYAPQYGGYCAWAVAQDKTAKGSAQHWAIVDGKLYLNFNKKIQSTWNEDREGFITSADANWPTVLQ